MATEAGIKHDHGKPRAALVVHGFAQALLEVSAVATFGAEKYSANGWVSVPNGLERYTDAMYRLRPQGSSAMHRVWPGSRCARGLVCAGAVGVDAAQRCRVQRAAAETRRVIELTL